MQIRSKVKEINLIERIIEMSRLFFYFLLDFLHLDDGLDIFCSSVLLINYKPDTALIFFFNSFLKSKNNNQSYLIIIY